MAVIDNKDYINDGSLNIVETFKVYQSDFDLDFDEKNIFNQDVLFVPATPALSVAWSECVMGPQKNMKVGGREYDMENVYQLIYYQEEFSENLMFEKMRLNTERIMNLFSVHSNLDGYIHDRRTFVESAMPGVRLARTNGMFYSAVVIFRIVKRKYYKFVD